MWRVDNMKDASVFPRQVNYWTLKCAFVRVFMLIFMLDEYLSPIFLNTFFFLMLLLFPRFQGVDRPFC